MVGGGRESLYLGAGVLGGAGGAGGACVISSVYTGQWLARTFSLAWSGRRSGIGGLMLPSLPEREVTAKKGSSRNKRGGGGRSNI